MVPELPQEVTDQVIDHLWDDPAALRACSLAQRVWLPSARTHLHRSIRVCSGEHLARLQDVLQHAPDVAQYVRQLILGGRTVPVGPSRSLRADAWLADAAPLLARLERLDDLTLTRLHCNALAAAPPAALRRITHLRVLHARFSEWADVHALLAAMPALRVLSFRRVRWDTLALRESGVEALPFGHVLPCLESLVHDSNPPHDSIMPAFLASGEELKLRSLSLNWLYKNDTIALGDLLYASGASLERVRLKLPNGIVEHAVSRDEISFRACSALQYVHFDGLHAPGYTSWVPVLLGQIPSARLRTVELSLVARRPMDLASFDWERLNNVFARPSWAGVRLVLNAPGIHGGVDVAALVAARLPKVAGQVTISVSAS